MIVPSDKTQVSLRNRNFLVIHNTTQTWHTNIILNRVDQILQVSLTTHIIEYDSGKGQLRIKTLKTHYYRRRTASHTFGIHHQNNRKPQPFCHLRG